MIRWEVEGLPLVLPEVLIVSPAPLSMPPGTRQGDDDVYLHDGDHYDDDGRGDDDRQPGTAVHATWQQTR